VDLGTTFSVVGINVNGKVIIIDDKKGHRIFPSIVSYLENGGFFYLLNNYCIAN
jgi:molecular chaperone DnaK (HSP70)